jgi:hypothetical protein
MTNPQMLKPSVYHSFGTIEAVPFHGTERGTFVKQILV